MDSTLWAAIIGAVLLIVGAILSVYLNLNNKVIGHDEKIISIDKSANDHIIENKTSFIEIRKEISDLKTDTKEAINDIKLLIKELKEDSKEERKILTERIDTFSTQLSNTTRTILSNSK